MNNMKIGSFLQALRKTKGLTQAELADYFEISSKTISKWECGDSLPELPMLKALAEFYEISVDEILNGERGEVKGNIKSRQSNETYFFNRHMRKLNFFTLLAASVLGLSIILLFALGYSLNRSDVGCWVSISIGFVSAVLFAFGCFLSGDLDESISENLITQYKRRKFWYCYCFISCLLFVAICAIIFGVIPPTPDSVLVISYFSQCCLFILLIIAVAGSLYPFCLYCLRILKLKTGRFIYTLIKYGVGAYMPIFALSVVVFSKNDYLESTGLPYLVWFSRFLNFGWFYWFGLVLVLLGIGLYLFFTCKQKSNVISILIQLIGYVLLSVAVNDVMNDINGMTNSFVKGPVTNLNFYLYLNLFVMGGFCIAEFIELIICFKKKRNA